MARISTYPQASSPQLSDKLIGTDVADANATKNYTIADIIGLIDFSIYVPYTGATDDVNITGYSLTADGINTDTISVGSGFTLNGGIAEFYGDIQAYASLYLEGSFIDVANSPGIAGQYLRSTGVATQWMQGPDLQDVFDEGSTASGILNLTGAMNLTGFLRVTGAFRDSSNDVGLSGQVLSSTVTGTNWITLGLQEILDADNEATAAMVLLGPGLFTGHITLSGTLNDSLDNVGIPGQVLTSTGTATQWKNLALYSATFFDSTLQTSGGVTTANLVRINSTQQANGFTLGTNRINVLNDGVYFFTANLQLAFTGGSSNYNVTVWYTINDLVVANSAFTFTTSSAQNDQTLAAVTDTIVFNAGDYIKFYWWSGAAGMTLLPTAAATNPLRPLSPSVNINIFNVG